MRAHAAVRIGTVVATAAFLGGSLATSAGAEAAAAPPAPIGLNATNGLSSIRLTWTQPSIGSRPVSFRVYEGSSVVARNTTTNVTIPDLAFNSTHTYEVAAVDSAGRESPRSTPVTRRVFAGGPIACGITPPSGLAVTAVTSSAVSLAWSNAIPQYDQAGTIVVLQDSVAVQQTTLDSTRIGGLAPATSYRFQVARRDCQGRLHTSTTVTVTTAAGPAARPTASSGLAVGARTASSIALSWAGVQPAAGYAVYEGSARVATTSAPAVVVRGLWRDTAHQYTVTTLDAAGNESAHTSPAQATTMPCPDATVRPSVVNPPTAVTATAMSSSSVALTWAQDFAATSFTVYRLTGAEPQPAATTRSSAAMVTGLPPQTAASFAVIANTACGPSALSAAATVTTAAGLSARPTAPTDLRVASSTANFDFTGTVTLSWTQPPGADPAVSYRLYEGITVLATTATPGVTLRLPGGPTHAVTVTAVDATGNESTQSNQVLFTAPLIPPP